MILSPSPSSPSVQYFLVVTQAEQPDGSVKSIRRGAVKNGDRLSAQELKGYFCPKAIDEIRKACRWIKAERVTPNWVDMTVTGSSYTVRVAPIKG